MTRTSSHRRIFYIHIMKTGGASLSLAMDPSFSPEERYPDAPDVDDVMTAKASIEALRTLPAERLARIRRFSVHMPFFVSQLVGPDVTTLTMLRAPVARVVSHLKQVKRTNPTFESMTLEEIYDIPWLFHSYFDNYQAKAFSMSAYDLVTLLDPDERNYRLAQYGNHTYNASTPEAEMLKAVLYAVGWDAPINDKRLAIAKANLERVDILGFLDRFEELLSTLEREYGLDIQRCAPTNTGHEEATSPDLLARIEKDNQYDMELYRYAQTLWAQRGYAPA